MEFQLPKDVQRKLEKDFGSLWKESQDQLRELVIRHKLYQSPRILRAIVFIAKGDQTRLKSAIKLAQIDWRDLLMEAEYTYQGQGKPPQQVRDFNLPFDAE